MAKLPTKSCPDSSPFSALAQQLNTWRAGRTSSGQTIPEKLWQSAVALGRHHGLGPTARALNLSYHSLQWRMAGEPRPRRGRPPKQPSFVEVSQPVVPSAMSQPETLELVHPSGARLRLPLAQASAKAVLPIVELFLRQRP